MNKQGFIADGVYYMVALFFVAISIIVGYVILDAINDAFQAEESFSATSTDQFNTFATGFPSIWDWTFIIIFIGLLAAALLISYLVPANPLFYFFLVFIIVVLGGFAGYMSNAWEDSTAEGALSDSADNFPMMSWVLENYLLVTVIVLMLMSVAFYAKPEGYF